MPHGSSSYANPSYPLFVTRGRMEIREIRDHEDAAEEGAEQERSKTRCCRVPGGGLFPRRLLAWVMMSMESVVRLKSPATPLSYHVSSLSFSLQSQSQSLPGGGEVFSTTSERHHHRSCGVSIGVQLTGLVVNWDRGVMRDRWCRCNAL